MNRRAGPRSILASLALVTGLVVQLEAQETPPSAPPTSHHGPIDDPDGLVDSLLSSPEISIRDRVAGLEALLRGFETPDEPWAYRASDALGRIYLAAGRRRLAIPYLEFAERGRPDDADLLNTLGYLYAEESLRLERAVELVRRALLAAPEETDEQTIGYYRDSLGWAFFKQGLIDSALVHLEAADTLAPQTPDIRLHLVDVYDRQDRIDDATEILVQDLAASRGMNASLRARLRRLHHTTPEGLPIEPEREVERRVLALEVRELEEIEALGGRVVRLRAIDGFPLTASLFVADGPPLGGVVLVHPMGAERGAYHRLAARFATAGITAVALDVRGHGASLSPELASLAAFQDQFTSSFRGAIEDVEAALDHLGALLDPGPLAVVGAHMGGLWGTLAGRDRDAVRGVALLSPRYSGELVRALTTHPGRRTLLVAGEADPPALAAVEKLAGELDPERTRRRQYPVSAGWIELLEGVPELEPFLVEWVKEALAPVAER